MNLDRGYHVPHFKGQQENFLYCSAQVETTLESRQVWRVVRGEDAASLSVSHQDRAELTKSTIERAMDDEYARYAGCSEILQRLGGVPYVCDMTR